LRNYSRLKRVEEQKASRMNLIVVHMCETSALGAETGRRGNIARLFQNKTK
jgi:hypothetical protein